MQLAKRSRNEASRTRSEIGAKRIGRRQLNDTNSKLWSLYVSAEEEGCERRRAAVARFNSESVGVGAMIGCAEQRGERLGLVVGHRRARDSNRWRWPTGLG